MAESTGLTCLHTKAEVVPVNDDIVAAKTEQSIKWKIICFLAEYTHMQKWPVVKEKHIKLSQELTYCLYSNWMMNGKKTISD